MYRFGHSMLDDTIPRKNEDGSHERHRAARRVPEPGRVQRRPRGRGPLGGDKGAAGAGSIIMGLSDQVGNELDEFIADTLRNNLLGLPLDLARAST